MCRDVSHPEPGHVGPDRTGTGTVSWGLGSGGVREGTVGLRGFWHDWHWLLNRFCCESHAAKGR